MRHVLPYSLLLSLGSCLTACSDEGQTAGDGLPPVSDAALETYARIAHEAYADSLALAQRLQAANVALVEEPSEETLEAARRAWLEAREPYLQTEVFRFYEGPIDNAKSGPEGMINAWPLDEAYIDYVEGAPDAGIINDPSVTIDAEELMELNEQGGEENIATGYHAIEFLLWGQDQNEEGPGDRPYTDYVTDGSGTADHQERRGDYLLVVSDLLVTHLEQLVEAWAPDDDENYRREFLEVPRREGLSRVFTGMVVLTGFETGGERLQTALDSGDQEDEHSCFSDNTHRDMVQDVQGVANVWRGVYRNLDGEHIEGSGARQVVAAVDPDLSDEIDERVADALGLAKDLQPPFDQEIAVTNEQGRERVRALVVALNRLEASLADAFTLLDLRVIDTP